MAGYLKTTLLFVSLTLSLVLVGCAAGPTHDETLNEEGYSAMQAGDMQEAERLLTAAIEENPDNLQAVLNLATLYQKTNRPEQARPLYQRVIDAEASAEDNGQDPDEVAHLAQIARDSIDEMDREEAQRQEELRQEALRQQAAAMEQTATTAAVMEPEPVAPPPVMEEIGYRIQVGAYMVAANAERMQSQLMKRHANLIKDVTVHMVEVGRMTKVQLGPYHSPADANKACHNLKRAGVDCFPIKK